MTKREYGKDMTGLPQANYEIMMRILYVYSKLNPGTGYV
jgi:hypothetical protein